MPIPEEILAVERPKSTRVKKSGDRYLVIKRTSKRVGDRTVPIELGTIGEIVDGKYVSIREQPRKKTNQVDIKDYGEFALCNKAAGNLLDELKAVYNDSDAVRLYVIALIRAMDPDIKNRDIQFSYETSYISEIYKNVHLSENTVSAFLESIGKRYNFITKFMCNRVETAAGKSLILDGTLKNNNSETNTFSEYSRKGKVKGSKDVSILYAYDPDSKEPIAARPYPGNMLDQTALEDFSDSFNIEKGIMVLDKGFYSKGNLEFLKSKDTLTYILPLKNNLKLVTENNMTDDIISPLDGYADATVFFKKEKINDNCYLYAFRDPKMAGDQEIGYVMQNKKKGTFSEEKLLSKRKEFGVIVFESKSDLDPLNVYIAYAGRWEIETMFNLYKEIMDLDTVNVQGDYRIYATEFINYLTVIISSRVKKLLSSTVIEKKKQGKKTVDVFVTDKYSFKQVYRYLSKSKMVRVGDSQKWVKNQTVKYIDELSKAIGV